MFGLMATSGGNFVSIAHLEIPLLIKMLMCQILIFPAVYGDYWLVQVAILFGWKINKINSAQDLNPAVFAR